MKILCSIFNARHGIPQKLISLIRSFYSESTSCVRVGNRLSPWFHIDLGVRQGCVVAPDSFVTGMDWLLERSVSRGMNGTIFGQYSFTDLDYVDDVPLLSEMLELLVPVLESFQEELESFQEEAAPLRLEVNWQKMMVQALGPAEDVPPSLRVCG